MEWIKKASLISLVLFLIVSVGVYYFHTRRTTPIGEQVQRPIVTVFIHGTFHLPILPKGAIKFIHNLIDKSVFAKKGLHKVTDLQEHYEQVWTKKFHHYHMLKTISDADPVRFPFPSSYIFCWSGQLSPQKRLSAAQKLYKALKDLVAEYQESQGVEPYIQLITHSHGGNVALNLARVMDDVDHVPLVIDELILLACPVQHETSHLIHHDMFKKIYSLHSHWDVIQVIDAQGWIPFKERVRNWFAGNTPEKSENNGHCEANKCFFSERHFELDSKLVQANMYYGRRGMLHVEFISESFMQHLPAVLAEIDVRQDKYLPLLDDIDMCIDLNPMIKQSRRVRLAAKKVPCVKS